MTELRVESVQYKGEMLAETVDIAKFMADSVYSLRMRALRAPVLLV